MTPPSWQIGDVVYVDGSSAILGDVVWVDEEGVTVAWRATRTVEPPEDLLPAPENTEALGGGS